MAAERRQSDNRRESAGGANDRRQKSDRRNESGRREVDSDNPRTGGGAKKAGARKPAADKKNRRMSLSLVFKRFAVVFMIAMALFTVLIIYFFSHLDYYMEKVAKRVAISVERAALDPESLTDRTTRARLNFRVKNTLPLAVSFQNLNFNVSISEYTVAKGMQASPKILIEGNGQTLVPVACNVDSIMTRRALQKTIERNAGPLLKGLLNRAQNKNNGLGDDIKGLVKITGSAEFRMHAGGVEIPFTRRLDF